MLSSFWQDGGLGFETLSGRDSEHHRANGDLLPVIFQISTFCYPEQFKTKAKNTSVGPPK